ncbi:hypothetical protein GOP47_0014957 [Adiantum capillus-veneris]|uniref:Uncharacterized protein n=1 Tax=Adiantum capillus-veneris TaxID=13818 RepID=A0A9D4ZCY6_ADICA|nr:hypothetical protein GOP47_0014957 [Adiantum capillus-veneris]
MACTRQAARNPPFPWPTLVLVQRKHRRGKACLNISCNPSQRGSKANIVIRRTRSAASSKTPSSLVGCYSSAVSSNAKFCQLLVAREVKRVKRYVDHATKVMDVHMRLLEDLDKLDMDAKSTLDVLTVEERDMNRQAETCYTRAMISILFSA